MRTFDGYITLEICLKYFAICHRQGKRTFWNFAFLTQSFSDPKAAVRQGKEFIFLLRPVDLLQWGLNSELWDVFLLVSTQRNLSARSVKKWKFFIVLMQLIWRWLLLRLQLPRKQEMYEHAKCDVVICQFNKVIPLSTSPPAGQAVSREIPGCWIWRTSHKLLFMCIRRWHSLTRPPFRDRTFLRILFQYLRSQNRITNSGVTCHQSYQRTNR